MDDFERPAPDRHRALAEATVAEFSRAGYEGASLNRIIRAAGMSKSSFYHFVGSKDELFDTVVRMLIADVAAIWTPPAPAEFAEFGARAFWRHVDELLEQLGALSATPALQHLGRIFYLPGGAEASGARAELLASVRAWVKDVLKTGRSSGAVRDELPLDLQADIVFAVLRAIDEWALAGGGMTAERAAVAASAPGLVLRRLLAA
ncbi:TetR/AcrR family transcriptional regulator [Microbacterium sp. KHB019]|uniref:TetR/AcrR family transcriptional regulator n=1 Tax=Microbacterium sp. KHB019 TaxID=3129770 RepID=UPI0030793DA0